jgi:hypothetical protein
MLHAVGAPRKHPFVQLQRRALSSHSDHNLAEIMSIEHPDKGCGRLLETIDDVLAIANAAVRDAGADLARQSAQCPSANL